MTKGISAHAALCWAWQQSHHRHWSFPLLHWLQSAPLRLSDPGTSDLLYYCINHIKGKKFKSVWPTRLRILLSQAFDNDIWGTFLGKYTCSLSHKDLEGWWLIDISFSWSTLAMFMEEKNIHNTYSKINHCLCFLFISVTVTAASDDK